MLSGLQVFKMLCQGFSVIATYIWTVHAANCTASENLREMTFSPHTISTNVHMYGTMQW